MIAGGNDTNTGLLGGAAELLHTDRGQRRILLDDPALIRPSIDEFLRLTSPVQILARTTTRDVILRGVDIPEGRKVMLAYAAANRDEREFGPTTDNLEVRRDFKRMLSFGYGPHLCLGASVARLSAGIAIERLLSRFPDFSVEPGGRTIRARERTCGGTSRCRSAPAHRRRPADRPVAQRNEKTEPSRDVGSGAISPRCRSSGMTPSPNQCASSRCG